MDKFESLCLLIKVALRSRGSTVGIVSRSGAGRSGVLYSDRDKWCFSIPKLPERKWGHSACYSMCTVVLFRVKVARA